MQRYSLSVVVFRCFIVAGLFTVFFASAVLPQEKIAPLHLHWGLGALLSGSDSLRFAPVRADTTLKSGDYLKLYLKISRPAYVYLVYCDPHGQVVPFFAVHRTDDSRILPLFTFGPWALDDYDNGDDTFYFPPLNAEWMSLDKNTGEERFYLLASVAPLEELHALLVAIRTGPALQQAELSARVVQEIERLLAVQKEQGGISVQVQSQASQAASPASASASQWDPFDRLLHGQVTEVTGDGLYIYPLTIHHVPAAAAPPPTSP